MNISIVFKTEKKHTMDSCQCCCLLNTPILLLFIVVIVVVDLYVVVVVVVATVVVEGCEELLMSHSHNQRDHVTQLVLRLSVAVAHDDASRDYLMIYIDCRKLIKFRVYSIDIK